MPSTPILFSELRRELEAATPLATKLQTVLELILKHWGAATGTLHLVSDDPHLLVLRAWRGLPESVLSIARQIPIGKGMAGVAAERRAPVTMCNLQTDQSGVARPGAKSTGAQGAMVVPMLHAGGQAADPERSELCGTLGIGMSGPRDFSEAEQHELLETGTLIASYLARSGTRV